jgi:zona occludens toxin
MIYLRTGANGSGKTLLTLRDVREKSLKESRPVYHNGRFKIEPDGPLKDWKEIKFEDWQSVPDGAIFIIDECHNELPPRPSSQAPAPWIKMLAEHRSRGFDFYLITQHPLNFDAFVRRLIGSPGWHQHLKRASGAPLVSVLQWAAVNERPEKAGSGASAQVSMVSYPKEVYKWYQSTSLDTAKIRIPTQLKFLLVAVVLIPLMGYYAYSTFSKRYTSDSIAKSVGVVSVATGAVPVGGVSAASSLATQTPAEYVASFAPRVEGLPQTAPRYAELTTPTVAPYPAACVSMGDRCDCYTQQATKLQVPHGLCVQIVKGGYFVDWQAALKQAQTVGAPVPLAVGAMPARGVPESHPVATADVVL